MITAGQVIELLQVLDLAGVEAWVDGGWGVDALLGEQSRPHGDLDLVVVTDSVPVVRALMHEHGFTVERDWLPTTLALRHADGRGVDFHPIAPTTDGGGDQILADGSGWHYDAPVAGHIAGRQVRCCSVETQLAAHLGYEPDQTDRGDMARLATRFNRKLSGPYTDPGRWPENR